MMRRLTTDEYKERIKEKHGDEYSVLGEYKTAKDKIKVRHNVCGRVWETKAENLYSKGCPECGYLKMKMAQRHTPEMFVSIVKELEGDAYEVLSDYVNNTTKVKMKHTYCGMEYLVAPRDFKSGKRCPGCLSKRISEGVTKDHKHFLERLGNSLEDDYEILTEYVNARTPMEMKHVSCGRVLTMRPHKILQGQRCSHCRRGSLGEIEVAKWLDGNGLKYVEQKTFPELRDVGLLRFDFGIVEGSKVRVLIEYNGLQHYEPIEYFGGEESFRERKKRDEIKKEYAQKHNIPLITIRYDEDVDEVLSKLIPR